MSRSIDLDSWNGPQSPIFNFYIFNNNLGIKKLKEIKIMLARWLIEIKSGECWCGSVGECEAVLDMDVPEGSQAAWQMAGIPGPHCSKK